jgi:hypothetical protein
MDTSKLIGAILAAVVSAVVGFFLDVLFKRTPTATAGSSAIQSSIYAPLTVCGVFPDGKTACCPSNTRILVVWDDGWDPYRYQARWHGICQ